MEDMGGQSTPGLGVSLNPSCEPPMKRDLLGCSLADKEEKPKSRNKNNRPSYFVYFPHVA